MVTYCTAADVANILQTDIFTTDSTPTLATVERIIERKESRIDQKLKHAWREATQTDLFLDMDYVDPRNGVRFGLPNYSLRTISKIEVWNGTTYTNYVGTKIEGRADDYWIDYTLGVLYIRKDISTVIRKPIRVTYTYGETSVNLEVEELCVYMAAVDVLTMFQQNVRFTDDGGSNTSTMDQRVIHFKGEIKKIFNSMSNISTI